ncbi:MAG: peptidoglycan DD-metalloendopeptidase family protein [Rhodospirillales bacterium]|nr:peptidoglycan DD-metalloendopeptidase family protein [Rhodospirillales bacterium]
MLLKGLFSVTVLVASVVASAGIILGFPAAKGSAKVDGTLALAPMSLGNPHTAVAGITTTRPDLPQDLGVTNATPTPIFQYKIRVGAGDTFAGLLNSAGVSNNDTQAAISALSAHYNPKHIRRGQQIALRFQAPALGTVAAQGPKPGRFIGLEVEPDYDLAVRVERTDASTGGDGFKARKIEKTLKRVVTKASGKINSSLYVSGRKAGIPNPVLVELIRAYSWDVDFQRDIRKGDGFEVMFEQFHDGQGRNVHSGNIQFAALTLSGKRHAIYLFTMPDGTSDYFDEKGQSARKALMSTPIDGARLSSGFGRRRHPILGYNKMHRGVDFAAPRGTPIYAAGNGVVVQSGRNGAYGNYVKVRHNSRYETAYAHMKSIARKARRGMRVSQGQVIGYVGTTGRSTGAHLHYEILAGGRRTNPMKVKMPSGKKLKGDALEDFQVARSVIDDQYAGLKPVGKLAEGKE